MNKQFFKKFSAILAIVLVMIVSISMFVACDKIVITGKTDTQKVAEAKSALVLGKTTYADNFTLPTSGKNNATISWTLKEASEYLSISGANATVIKPETEQEITLIATIVVGKASDTKEFDIIITATSVPIQTHTIVFNETSLVTIAVSNGDIPVASGSALASGTVLTVKVTLKDSTNYEVSKVLLNGQELSQSDGSYTFTLDENSTITVETKSLSTDNIGTTANHPYSVAKIIEWTNSLSLKDGEYTDSKYYLRGIVKSFEAGDSTKYVKNVYLVDEAGSSTSFLVYSCDFTSEVASVNVGDTVVVYGAIKNYQGTIEMSNVRVGDTQIHSYPEFISREEGLGLGTISIGTAPNADVVIGENQTSGKNGTTFTFTVTPDKGYKVTAVKVNGVTVSADDDGVYIGTINGNTIITVSTSKEGSSSTGGGSVSSNANWATDYNGYYKSLVGNTSTGAAFRSALASIVKSTYKETSTYSGLTTYFKQTDEDPNNPSNMIWWYSGTSVSKNIGTTNREHVWPKDGGKAFPAEQGPSRDLHHMRPTDTTLNSSRGNNSFAEVTGGKEVKQNGITNYTSAINGGSGVCYTGNSYFYPSAGMRGATARVLMYVQLMWGDEYSLKFVVGAGNCKTIGDIKTLMKWHLEEPVSEFEKIRNERVFGIQKNRNPFVDYPELAERIFCYDGQSYNNALLEVVNEYKGATNTDIESITLSASSVPVGGSVGLNATYSPSNANADVTWYSSNPAVATVDAYGRVTGVSVGKTTITVMSTKNTSVYASVEINVVSISSIQVIGVPTKTAYDEGNKFNPAGLSVKLIYSDGNTGVADVENCEWLDGLTGRDTLSVGTTTVTCKYGGLQYTVSGITVSKMQGSVITLTRTSVSWAGKYDWCTWTSGNVSGKVYGYGQNAYNAIQLNKTKDYCYLINTTALPNITKIKITTAEGCSAVFSIHTSSTPFDTTSKPYPKTGTSHGEKTVTSDGTTWTFENLGTEQYFAINYVSSSVNAIYITSIEITYGN